MYIHILYMDIYYIYIYICKCIYIYIQCDNTKSVSSFIPHGLNGQCWAPPWPQIWYILGESTGDDAVRQKQLAYHWLRPGFRPEKGLVM